MVLLTRIFIYIGYWNLNKYDYSTDTVSIFNGTLDTQTTVISVPVNVCINIFSTLVSMHTGYITRSDYTI